MIFRSITLDCHFCHYFLYFSLKGLILAALHFLSTQVVAVCWTFLLRVFPATKRLLNNVTLHKYCSLSHFPHTSSWSKCVTLTNFTKEFKYFLQSQCVSKSSTLECKTLLDTTSGDFEHTFCSIRVM